MSYRLRMCQIQAEQTRIFSFLVEWPRANRYLLAYFQSRAILLNKTVIYPRNCDQQALKQAIVISLVTKYIPGLLMFSTTRFAVQLTLLRTEDFTSAMLLFRHGASDCLVKLWVDGVLCGDERPTYAWPVVLVKRYAQTREDLSGYRRCLRRI